MSDYTETKGLAIAKEVFLLLQKHRLSEIETYMQCCLMAALAASTVRMPKKGLIESIEATFEVTEGMHKRIKHEL